jgi:hypothetical protein
MSNSRRERRQLAKNFGLLGRDQTFSQRIERFGRSREMGKQLHLRHLEEVINSQLEQERKKEEDRIIKESSEIQMNEDFVLSNQESFEFLKKIDYLEIKGSDE